MTSVPKDIKDKPSEPTNTAPPQQGEEQQFRILPHPAKSNDPADLQKPSEETGGLRSGQDTFGAFTNNPGPVIPDEGMLKNISPPKSREELRAEQAQLNSEN